MVCVAAFIILCLVGIVVAVLSIFKREIGRNYLKVFKKAWHCVFKKVRLQKCDTNFKDDVRNTILKRVILKHPKWVRPLSIIIEVFSVLIVVITIWSIIIAIKSLLALWVFGTCNVSQPSQCSLGAETCTIDQDEPRNIVEKVGRSFGEWGQIVTAIPDRLKTWRIEDYLPANPYVVAGENTYEFAIDIIDPGCSVCMQSYKNQKSSGFDKKYNIYYLFYGIAGENDGYKFKNSGDVVRHLYAPGLYTLENPKLKDISDKVPIKILDRIFTENNDKHINYLSVFNNELSHQEAKNLLTDWYQEFGFTKDEAKLISEFAYSDTVTEHILEVNDIVENKVHAKGIPTFIYDGKKHNGLFK